MRVSSGRADAATINDQLADPGHHSGSLGENAAECGVQSRLNGGREASRQEVRRGTLTLDPLEFSFADGFRDHECSEILRITSAHLDEFLRAWYLAFGGLNL